MKKIISFFIALTLMMSSMISVSQTSVIANDTDVRSGFVLTPSASDSTGISIDSTFTLLSQNSVSLNDITTRLSIDNEPLPVITEKSANNFEIVLSRPFKHNKLYTFRITIVGGDDITWVFQTRTVFEIESTLPADKSTSVPVNTGIELYFSNDNYESIDNYFEISPNVEGRFEKHGKTCVFVPNELKNGTLYTVTVKKGLKLEGTQNALGEDYVFAFETIPSDEQTPDNTYRGYFSYYKSLNEFATSEKPSIPLYYYINTSIISEPSITVNNKIYSYSDTDSFIEALGDRSKIPMWAYYNFAENQIKTEGLSKVLEFNQSLPSNDYSLKFINVPQTLPAGYYMIDSNCQDINFQTFFQVTDIGMYIIKSNEKSLIWLNDLSSKTSIIGAEIVNTDLNLQYTTNSDGVAFFDTPAFVAEDELNPYDDTAYLKITATDGKTAVMKYSFYSYNYRWGQDKDMYWNYLFMDRSIYKPDDTVSLWGMAKNRYSGKNIKNVTVEISQGYGYGRYYDTYMNTENSLGVKSNLSIIGNDAPLYYNAYEGDPILSETLSVENGIYKGSLELPSPEQGNYRVIVKDGDTVISNSYITVKNYSKPTYNLTVEGNKEAMFLGETVNFEIKASFFEGTGLPKLPVKITVTDSFGNTGKSYTKNTNSKGVVDFAYTPSLSAGSQGIGYATISVSTSDPEIGEISDTAYVRVFANDIDASFETNTDGEDRTIKATVKTIDLYPINSGTTENYWDYLGQPVTQKELIGTVYRNSWNRIEDGTYYDFINKTTEKRYRYELNRIKISDFFMTTDTEGKAEYTFTADTSDEIYYTAEINCVDNSGRTMNFDVYIYGYYPYEYSYQEDDNYKLSGGKDSYKAGDEVNLTFKKGTQTMPNGSYLFIKSQNGLRNYVCEDGPQYLFEYAESDMPNTFINGVYFNGLTYVESGSFNAVFDSKTKELTLSATTDKETYKPGEIVTVNVSAKDKNQLPKKAIVNLSMVDEALFKLEEQYVDTLASLYQSVPSGIDFSYSSHQNSQNENLYGISYLYKSVSANALEAVGNYNKDVTGSSSDEPVRENFKDTAFFDTIVLGDDGTGQFSFKLPDNITSWRITLNGVTEDLMGGSNKVNLNVTMPFFINYTLNDSYLTGDKPSLGVTAYGTGLLNDDNIDQNISYTVSSTSGDTITAIGKSFERIYIPLWELKAGTTSITIKAKTSTGLSDAIKHNISVVNTYNEYDQATYKKLVNGVEFTPGTKGTAKLIFSDRSRGSFLPALTSLSYTYGNRIDQRIAANVAQELIKKYFPKYAIGMNTDSLDVSEYQKSDGGIAILPYSSSNTELTAKLVTLIKDDANISVTKLKEYFNSILEKENSSYKCAALYGLASLKEPVLLNLDEYAEILRLSAIDNLNVKNTIFVALAYCELGETGKANNLYDNYILKHIKKIAPYYRVSRGVTADDILECTSLASILASKLNKIEKTGLYKYVLANSTSEILINIEKLLYISGEIENFKEETVKFAYTLYGKKHYINLSNGNIFVLRIPEKNLGKLKISNVSGTASVVAIRKVPEYTVKELSNNISVKRSYSVYNSDVKNTTVFKRNDIVKVKIFWNIGNKALDGSYEISDYLPAGLKPIENDWKFGSHNYWCYRKIDGQKVTFYAYKYNKMYYERPFVYYARVISPGIFKADATTIQSLRSADIINIGTKTTITIK